MTLEELLNESVLPVVVTDDLGVVTHVNEAFSAAWGWTSGDLVGRPITAIIPQALRDAHHIGFSTFLATGRPTLLNRKVRLQVLRKDGSSGPADHFIVAERGAGRRRFGATVVPVP